MDLHPYTPDQLPVVLRVLRTALQPDGALDPTEHRFLVMYARLGGIELGPDDPPVIDAADVRLDGAHARKRLVQLAALAVLLSRPVRAGAVAFLRALARRLATHDPVIDVIGALHRGRALEVRLRTMRRVMRVMLKEAILAEGMLGPVRLIGAMALRRAVNTDRVWDYKRLGLMPHGTLGRAYWQHMTEQGFGFPGEPAGIAASVAYHDLGHVLAGHEATPLGEIQQGCFQGGNRREDGYVFIQFVILHFHQGVTITPGAPPATGHFDPERVLWAIHRGERCNVDMTHQWDYWPLMPLPLEQARAACALLPPFAA